MVTTILPRALPAAMVANPSAASSRGSTVPTSMVTVPAAVIGLQTDLVISSWSQHVTRRPPGSVGRDRKNGSADQHRTPAVAYRYADLLATLGERQRRAIILRLTTGFYEEWHPCRSEIAFSDQTPLRYTRGAAPPKVSVSDCLSGMDPRPQSGACGSAGSDVPDVRESCSGPLLGAPR
jgi:hypothetical protein